MTVYPDDRVTIALRDGEEVNGRLEHLRKTKRSASSGEDSSPFLWRVAGPRSVQLEVSPVDVGKALAKTKKESMALS